MDFDFIWNLESHEQDQAFLILSTGIIYVRLETFDGNGKTLHFTNPSKKELNKYENMTSIFYDSTIWNLAGF